MRFGCAAVSLKALVALCLAGTALAASTRAPRRRPCRSGRRSSIPTSSAGRTPRSGSPARRRRGRPRSRCRSSGTPSRRPRGPPASSPRTRPIRHTTGSQLDAQLRLVRAHGLEPIVYIAGPPSWAKRTSGGFARPDPARVSGLRARRRAPLLGRRRACRASATGRRGTSRTRCRTRPYKPGAAAWYRALVNAFAASVHSRPGQPRRRRRARAVRNLDRGRAARRSCAALLCVSSGRSPHATCSDRVRFDIWSTHPYTAGGPTHQALPAERRLARRPAGDEGRARRRRRRTATSSRRSVSSSG